MLATLQAKLIAALVLVIALGVGLTWFGGHERGIGAAGVQAKWDAATDAAKATSAAQTLNWTKQFSAIGAQYEATTHAQAPSIADTVAADVRAGTVRLRDEPACRGVSEAAARSRAADAAAAATATQRLADSVAAVRAGDEADAREQQLREQVIGLQGVLVAERK